MTRLLLVCALALSLSPAAAQPAPKKPAAKAAAIQLPAIETFTLGNGLQVAVLPVEAAPIVSVQLWYHAGSKDEPANRRGMAKMFERLMFEGSKRVRPDHHAQLIAKLGGYTSSQADEDSTHFSDVLPSAYVDFALELEAERMRNLVFSADAIDAQRTGIKDNVRANLASPINRGFLEFLEAAYTVHPYAWTTDGTIADLDKITAEDLQRFYDTYYQPNNALLVVVGRTTAADVKAAAEKHFGGIDKGPAPPRPADAATEPEQKEKRRKVTDPSPAPAGLVFTGFTIPAAKDPDTYALQVAAIILGSGESSRLKTNVRKTIDKATKLPVGADAGLEIRLGEHPGFLVTLGVYRDSAPEKVEQFLFDEITKLGAKGPTADELRKAKNQIQAFFVSSLEDANGLATQIGRSWVLTGDGTQWVRDLAEFEKVTGADVQRVLKKYMTTERATVVVIPPKGK
jgi:zinc protease